MPMEQGKFGQEFKKMDLAEQGTFFILGAIDTVFTTLTNTFKAVADTSYDFADFTRPGASEKLGAKSLDAILGFGVKTDAVKRPDGEKKDIPVKPAAKASTIPIKKVENGNGGESA
ncbi:MAG: hypothetical protein HY22_12490 [[Candidatus Thermochlorobacteriaceae] bacterium GBChlB]|jgi:hypothetical protein|nr:MAG: hypothetical protein HY22_12490 [[Candidatus Thermochlorobacteriaceae] bacterium GBChlB]